MPRQPADPAGGRGCDSLHGIGYRATHAGLEAEVAHLGRRSTLSLEQCVERRHAPARRRSRSAPSVSARASLHVHDAHAPQHGFFRLHGNELEPAKYQDQ
jgi:hypothetical protein